MNIFSCFHVSRRLLISGMMPVLALLVGIAPLFGLDHDLNLEAQLVGNLSFEEGKFELYSFSPWDVKQKPGLGAAYRLGFGTEEQRSGYLALQGRVAYSEHTESNLQMQLYDAYANLNMGEFDLWAGHHRTPVGLSSHLDSHPLIMFDNTLYMSGCVNYDRDWGVGAEFDRHYPKVNLAVTTGSGMPLKIKENFLLSGRVGWWDYAEDDIAVGVSAEGGKILQTIGYEILNKGKRSDVFMGGLDFSKKIANFYGHADVLWGSYEGHAAHRMMGRLGLNLGGEYPVNMEIQGMNIEKDKYVTNILSLGAGYELSPNVTLRGVVNISNRKAVNSLVMQLYYHKGL